MKKITFYSLVILLLISMAGCTKDIPTSSKAEDSSDIAISASSSSSIETNLFVESAENMRGNTIGNIAMGGWTVCDDEWLYYHDWDNKGYYDEEGFLQDSDCLYRMRFDGSERTMISTVNASSLNLYDGWLYFVNASAVNGLEQGFSKMKPDGSELECIYKESFTNISVVDGWAYGNTIIEHNVEGLKYRTSYNGGIIRMSLDGSKVETLIEKGVMGCIVSNGWIYYQDIENHFLHRIRTDGTEEQLLAEIPVGDDSNFKGDIIPFGDWVYFNNRDDNSCLYRVHKSDGSIEKVAQEPTYGMMDTATGLLFTGSKGTFFLNIPENSTEPILENSLFEMQSSREWIYAYVWGIDGTQRMRLDGSELQPIAAVSRTADTFVDEDGDGWRDNLPGIPFEEAMRQAGVVDGGTVSGTTDDALTDPANWDGGKYIGPDIEGFDVTPYR